MSPARDSTSPFVWARFRFSIVGPLLSSPPPRGELKATLDSLAAKTWRHPITGAPLRYSTVTIERWYYAALNAGEDPVGALRRLPRKDAGRQVALTEPLCRALLGLYRAHRGWSMQLLHDNLAALSATDSSLGPMPSYSTVRRFLRAHGLWRLRRGRNAERPGVERAQERLDSREVRSYEAEYVGSLWHLDFHVSSLKVLTPGGLWMKPMALAILDDHSRLACHIQWYLSETAEDLVHGLSQAFQKRGLPRALLTDNGSAMVAEEHKAGLLRLGIVHETTLPYSPYQNGKQESFWCTLEGRLMAMLEGVRDLTLVFLNEATQAWMELEYNRMAHGELGGQTPLERFAAGPEVLRPSPSSQELRDAFRQETVRTQRRSDGTVSLEGLRFEVPGRYRHLERIHLRYARWNLRRVHMVDARAGTVLCQVYPLDKTENSDGRRRELEPTHCGEAPAVGPTGSAPPDDGMAPLLKKLLSEYSRTGIPPAYLPGKDERKDTQS